MPDARRAICKNCRRHRDECGLLSWRGLCSECGPELVRVNGDALHRKTGPEFRRWRRAMAACVGGVLLDDARTET